MCSLASIMKEEIETLGVSQIQETILSISSQYGKQEYCYCVNLLSTLSRFKGSIKENELINMLATVYPDIANISDVSQSLQNNKIPADDMPNSHKTALKIDNVDTSPTVLTKGFSFEIINSDKPISSENMGVEPPPPPKGKKKLVFSIDNSNSNAVSVDDEGICNSSDKSTIIAESKPPAKKKVFKKPLNIDTDSINQSMPIGGDMGNKYNEDASLLEQDILQLADYCIKAMNRLSINDPIIDETSNVQTTELLGHPKDEERASIEINQTKETLVESIANSQYISKSKITSLKEEPMSDIDIMLIDYILGWVTHSSTVYNVDYSMKVQSPDAIKLLIRQTEYGGFILKTTIIQKLESLANQNKNAIAIVLYPGFIDWLLTVIHTAKANDSQLLLDMCYKFLRHTIGNIFATDKNAHKVVQMLVSWTDKAKSSIANEIWSLIISELNRFNISIVSIAILSHNISYIAFYLMQFITNKGNQFATCDDKIITEYMNLYCIYIFNSKRENLYNEKYNLLIKILNDKYLKSKSLTNDSIIVYHNCYSIECFIDIVIYAFVSQSIVSNPELAASYTIYIINSIEFDCDRKHIPKMASSVLKLLYALGTREVFSSTINQIEKYMQNLRKVAIEQVPSITSLANEIDVSHIFQRIREEKYTGSSPITLCAIPPNVGIEWGERTPFQQEWGSMPDDKAFDDYNKLIELRKWRKEKKKLTYWGGAWRNQQLLESGKLPLVRHSHENSNRVPNLMVIAQTSFKYLRSSGKKYTNENLDYSELFNNSRPLVSDTIINGQLHKYLSNLFKGKANFECEIIKMFYNIGGSISIIDGKILFIKNLLAVAKESYTFFSYKFQAGQKMVYQWKIQNIEFAWPRRYINQTTCFQIYFANHRSVLINFSTNELMKQFISKLKDAIYTLGISNQINFGVFQAISNASLMAPHISSLWEKREITNFQYIIWLNHISSRSFHDISQYPVFPWVLSNYSLNPFTDATTESYRRLDLPIGMNGNDPKRKQIYMERGSQDDSYNYGSHYSSPGMIFHYLLRLHPFYEGHIELFSGSFDLPVRQFISITDRVRSAMTEVSDVCELVPEMYSLPEILVNVNNLKLGQVNECDIGNVILPHWAKDPYDFIRY